MRVTHGVRTVFVNMIENSETAVETVAESPSKRRLTVQMNLRVDPPLKEAFDRLVGIRYSNKSILMREAILDILTKHGQPVPDLEAS